MYIFEINLFKKREYTYLRSLLYSNINSKSYEFSFSDRFLIYGFASVSSAIKLNTAVDILILANGK